VTRSEFYNGSEKGTASVHQILCQSWEKCCGNTRNDSKRLQGPNIESCSGVSTVSRGQDRSGSKNGGDGGTGVYIREGTTSRVTAADRSYGKFYDFYSVSPETFGSTLVQFNPLAPSDPYMGRTAQLTSRQCILNTYSTNIRTEYFKSAT
jgi:hypothetical protein